MMRRGTSTQLALHRMDEKLSDQTVVRITPSQRRRWTGVAQAAGISLGELIRRSVEAGAEVSDWEDK